MATYKQDPMLPSHGRRAKADNTGTIRVRITRKTGSLFLATPEAFDFYLNICPAGKTYNATVEYEEEFGGKKKVVPVEVPTIVIENIIKLSGDKTFMALTNDVVFSDIIMLDGNNVRISIKTDAGNLTLEDNTLDDTLKDGIISYQDNTIQTPFNRLAAIAFKELSIE